MLTCTFENGGKATLRHAIVDIMLINNNKILLEKRAHHLHTAPGKYALIGGFVNRDETLKEAAIREAREETGYDIEIEALFRIIDDPKRPQEDRQNIMFLYIAHPIKKIGEKDRESSEIKWFGLNNLPPKKDFAFDHFKQIQLYKQQIKKPFDLSTWER